MAKKKSSHRSYTKIGARIAELGTQQQIATALKVSQQTISKKLRGECEIMLSDLETIAKKNKLKMAWFFEPLGKSEYPSMPAGK